MESRFLGWFPWKIIWKSLAPLKVSVFMWKPRMGVFWHVIIYKRRELFWWINILCAKRIWSLLITYFYIVNLQGLYGSYPLVAWESPGLSRILWGIIFWLGKVLLVGKLKREASYWSHMRFFGLFGERETKESLKERRRPSTNQRYSCQESFFLGYWELLWFFFWCNWFCG